MNVRSGHFESHVKAYRYGRREQLLTESRGDDSVFILPSSAHFRGIAAFYRRLIPALLAMLVAAPCGAQEDKQESKQNLLQPKPAPAQARLASPPKIEEVPLVPELRTIPVPHDRN